MSNVQLLPLGNYNSRAFGPIDIADGISDLIFNLARCTTATPTTWPNASTTVAINLECSVDGGATYVGCGSGTSQGGIEINNRTQQERTVTSIHAVLPSGTGRKFQGTVVIGGGPMRTSVSVDVN